MTAPGGTTAAAEHAPRHGRYPADDERTEGRRLLDAMAGGLLPAPPAAVRFGLPLPAAWSPGHVLATAGIGPEHLLPSGVVFGGYLACLVDHIAGLAMYTVLPDGGAFLTATLDVAFRAPVRPGDALLEGAVRVKGSRQVVIDVTVTQHGQEACRAVVEQVLLPHQRPGP